ncbi:MAG: trigger factor [Pedobacter sp.]|nr:MAG: trigger factor [Pedobacter sp.]
MNITQEKISDLNAILKVTLNPEDYNPKVEKALKDQAKKANLPGFRKGMVPVSHIKRMFGKSILVEEINTLLSDSVTQYLTDEKVEVLGQPLPLMDETEFKWDQTDVFEFQYEIGLAPVVDIEVSAKDKFTEYDVKADADTLKSRISNLRKSYGKMSNPEVSAEGDVLYSKLVQLDTKGEVFEGGIESTGSIRMDLVNDKKILKSLVGLKKDDTLTLNINKAFEGNAAVIAKLLNISEEDASDLTADFQVTILNVNRLEESDLNQEFFDKIFGEGIVTDEKAFEAKITEEIESMFKQDSARKLQSDIYAQYTSQTKMELPDEFLKKWLKTTNEKLTDKELEEGYAEFATNLKWTLIENKIIKENDIKIEYKDVFETAKQRIDAQFKMYSQQELPEDQLAQFTVNFLQEKENANRIFDEVKAEKVFDFIKSTVTIDKKEIAYNKFIELK